MDPSESAKVFHDGVMASILCVLTGAIIWFVFRRPPGLDFGIGSWTRAALLTVVGVAVSSWGCCGSLNSKRLYPGDPPSPKKVHDLYFETHRDDKGNAIKLTEERLADPKTREWVRSRELAEADYHRTQLDYYHEKYPSFEYPPIALSLPAFFVGLLLVGLGGYLLYHHDCGCQDDG